MKILIVHNRYRSDQPSGENRAVDRQIALLRDAGHEVVSFERDSDEIGHSLPRKVAASGSVVWSRSSRRDIERTLGLVAPDIVHIHNTFPLISPSVLAPCAEAAAVVVSMHNYRLICPQGQLLRNGEPCELCVGRIPWRAVRYGCYRNSRAATAPLAAAVAAHRALDVWNRNASAFVALSAFSADKLVAGGLDPARVHVLPNFAPGPARLRLGPGAHFLYLGRLSAEKAPDLLVRAWRREFGRLLIAGDGPLRGAVESTAVQFGESVQVLGLQTPDRAMNLLADARALIVPSRLYEVSPLVVPEAYARGVPVIAPAHGAFAELIDDRETGRLFTPGDETQLAACIHDLCDDGLTVRLGSIALSRYEESFSPDQYLRRLLGIYEEAIQRAGTRRSADLVREAPRG